MHGAGVGPVDARLGTSLGTRLGARSDGGEPMVITSPALALAAGTAEQFDAVYSGAAGDPSRVPWSDGVPNPAMVTWLNAIAPSLIRCGARVAVVGCGLGEDARELIRRGYDVTAFDFSAVAVDWARALDPENASCYHCADAANPPSRWVHRFDLVVEINTLQAVPIARRGVLMSGIARLAAANGHVLVICRAAESPVSEADTDGPPWPLTRGELVELARASGFVEEMVDEFEDDEVPPRRRLRALLRKTARGGMVAEPKP